MKRAGLIIGVVVILLAVVLFGVSQLVEKKNMEKITLEQNQINQNKDIVEEPNNDKLIEPEVKEPEVIEPEVKEPEVIERVVEKKVSEVMTINKSTLGDVHLEKEGIVVIAEKRLILLDEDYGTSNGKMLTYCFDVLTTDNMKLVLFMTEKAFNNYEVGDKLLVKYNIYKNADGILFPVVLSVSEVSN